MSRIYIVPFDMEDFLFSYFGPLFLFFFVQSENDEVTHLLHVFKEYPRRNVFMNFNNCGSD